MAKTGSRSLASRAGSVARRVVGRGTSDSSGTAAKKSAKKVAKTAPAKAAAAKKAPTKAAAKQATKKTAQKTAQKAAQKTAQKTAQTTQAAPVRKGAPAKAAKKQAPAKAAKKTPAKRTPAKKAPASTAGATKTAAATQAAPVRKAAPAKAAKTPAKAAKTPAKAPAKTPAETPAEVGARSGSKARKGSPAALVVLPGESRWTKDELAEVRNHLRADVKRLSAELEVAEGELQDLMRDAGDGAGHDQADVGSTTFERDQEMVITANAREMLTQSQHALERIADGSYGVCEGCGEAIGKMRLMAFPRATLCMTCKQREERR
jgi:RNA polymerase-binding protein DksA